MEKMGSLKFTIPELEMLYNISGNLLGWMKGGGTTSMTLSEKDLDDFKIAAKKLSEMADAMRFNANGSDKLN